RRVAQTDIDRQLACDLPLILYIRSEHRIAEILERVRGGILLIGHLTLHAGRVACQERRKTGEGPCCTNDKWRPGILAQASYGAAPLNGVRARGPRNVVSHRELIRDQIERQRSGGPDRRHTGEAPDGAVFAACGSSKKLQWMKTGAGNGPLRYCAAGNRWTPGNRCVFPRPRES